MVATVQIAVHGVEVETNDVSFTDGHVEDGGTTDQILFSPGLAALDEGFAVGAAPFHDDSTAIFGAVEAGGAISHAQPAARSVIERKILAEDVGVGGITVGDGMVRTIEGDAHVGAGSTRRGLLRGGRRCAAASGCAAGNAAGRAADESYQTAFERQHAAAAEGDHQAAIVDEALDLSEAFVADAAGDVVGFGGRAEAGGLCGLLKRHG